MVPSVVELLAVKSNVLRQSVPSLEPCQARLARMSATLCRGRLRGGGGRLRFSSTRAAIRPLPPEALPETHLPDRPLGEWLRINQTWINQWLPSLGLVSAILTAIFFGGTIFAQSRAHHIEKALTAFEDELFARNFKSIDLTPETGT